MPKDPRIKKVMVIGSGPIIIGQAAEFDYSGTQACRALKSEGIETVLVNSNPRHHHDRPRYRRPCLHRTADRPPLSSASSKKKSPTPSCPTSAAQMGPQPFDGAGPLRFFWAAAACACWPAAPTPSTAPRTASCSRTRWKKLHQPIVPSKVVEELEDAVEYASTIGYPVIVRPAFTMGGTGGGICEDEEKLREIATNGLRLSPIHQILVEKCIAGWKEIEYEVMRDSKGNVITVCNMENLDPVGVHTGDSIVVAPSQTLSDKEYQMLAHRRAGYHHRARHRGRLQLPVCLKAGQL